MKLELPEWLGPQRQNRTRGFLIIKIILFICLIVAIIETLLYIPIYYKILEDKAREAPVGDNANVWVVALSTGLSVMFGLVVIVVGIIGVLKENALLVCIYAVVLLVGVVFSLFTYHDYAIVIFAAISNVMVATISFIYAYLITKYDRQEY